MLEPTARHLAAIPAHPPPQIPARSRCASYGHKHTGSKVPLRRRISPPPARHARPGVHPAAILPFASPLPPPESPAVPLAVPEPIPPAPTNARRTTRASAVHAAQNVLRG